MHKALALRKKKGGMETDQQIINNLCSHKKINNEKDARVDDPQKKKCDKFEKKQGEVLREIRTILKQSKIQIIDYLYSQATRQNDWHSEEIIDDEKKINEKLKKLYIEKEDEAPSLKRAEDLKKIKEIKVKKRGHHGWADFGKKGSEDPLNIRTYYQEIKVNLEHIYTNKGEIDKSQCNIFRTNMKKNCPLLYCLFIAPRELKKTPLHYSRDCLTDYERDAKRN